MNKKIILGLGTLGAIGLPIATVISCTADSENIRTNMATEQAKVQNSSLTLKTEGETIASLFGTKAKGEDVKSILTAEKLSKAYAETWGLAEGYTVEEIVLPVPGSEISENQTSIELHVTLKSGNNTGTATTMLYIKDGEIPAIAINEESMPNGWEYVAADLELLIPYGSSATPEKIEQLISASDNIGVASFTFTWDKPWEKEEDGSEYKAGTYKITAKATDTQGNEATQEFTITINPKAEAST